MSECGKTRADSITITLHRSEFGWGGVLVVNGDPVSECNAGSAAAVLDSVWAGAFYDDVSGDALYTTDEASPGGKSARPVQNPTTGSYRVPVPRSAITGKFKTTSPGAREEES